MGGGPPGFPQGSTCPVVLRCRLAPWDLSPTGLSPPAVGRSRPLRLDPPVALSAILQPPLPFGNGFGLFPVRSPLLRKSSSPCGDVFFLFLRVLRCFSSPRSLLLPYVFRQGYRPITTGGFPHSEIPGSMLAYSSPRHFAVGRVLLRLPAPRHPPYALCSLTFSRAFSLDYSLTHVLTCASLYAVFKVRAARNSALVARRSAFENAFATGKRAESCRGSLDPQNRTALRVVRFKTSIDFGCSRPYFRSPAQTERRVTSYERREPLLRKEVIQPHLPIRLPCYDFTLITCSTLDGLLPSGLRHRLRV